MFHLRKIESFDSPELEPYRTMRRSLEQQRQGIFVAEGEKVVRRLLESRFTVLSVVLPEKWLEDFRPLLEARPEQIPVYLADKKLLETLVGFSMFQGLLAVGKIPAPDGLEEVLQTSKSPRLFVAIEGLTNAENLGALVRNCAAFNVQALIVGETSGSPFLRRAVRNSMGTIFQMPVVETASLVQTLHELRARGIRCVAAHPDAESWHPEAGSASSPPAASVASARATPKLKPDLEHKTIFKADFRGDCCILFGSEGYGISAAALETCDQSAAIPMPPTVDSLNVGAAAAVFLYEVNRQRANTVL
jgi:tRNA G18 (ribose-2'-O)-methylase SpoU